MKGLSVHVVDIANGVVARGMQVEVWRRTATAPDGAGPAWQPLVTGTVADNGVVSGLAGQEAMFVVGDYEVRLHVAAYYRAIGTVLAEPPFMAVQLFRFGLADTEQHIHLPVKLTPHGLSCFRGA